MFKKLTAALCAAIFAFLCVAPLAAQADDAAALLAKHRAFVGWQYGDGSFKSLSTTVEVTDTKKKKTDYEAMIKRAGIIYRQDIFDVAAKTSSSNGFTGNIGWTSDENGFTVPVIGDPAKYDLASNLLFAEATSELPGTLHGTATVDGTPCTIVRVVQAKAFPIDLYIDPATGAYKRAVIDPSGDDEATIDILAYKEAAPGKKIMGTYKYHGSRLTSSVTKIVANGPISNEQLQPPSQSAEWTFGDATPMAIAITSSRVRVDATINGVLGHFILDTGAAGLFFSQDFADRAHLKKLGSTTSSSIGGKEKDESVIVDSLTIHGNTLHNVRALAGGSALNQEGIDGLLGFPVWASTITTIDFVNHTLLIQDPAKIDSAKLPGIHVVADLSTFQPRVPMKINNSIDINALLDTGAPNLTLISPDLRKYGFKMLIDDTVAGAFTSYRAIGGATGGYTIGECGHIDSLNLGPIAYQFANTCTVDDFSGRDALLGFDFLSGFHSLTLDYSHSGIIIVPNTK